MRTASFGFGSVRRWVFAAVFFAAAALLLGVTCNTNVEREEYNRELTVVYCEVLPGGFVLCAPFAIEWSTRFKGSGHEHKAESTTQYYFHLHNWHTVLIVESVFDDDQDPVYPFQITAATSNHVYSYSLGDLGFLVGGSCEPALFDAHDLNLQLCWSGSLSLDRPGGYGEFKAGISALGVIPVPLPNDDVQWPWYMYHDVLE